MKRFEDYKKEVILAYEKKKKEGTLPPNLHSPTAANLKNECLNVFHNRYTAKDAETFKTLFQERNSAEEYLKMIQKSEADQFKALTNFLKGNTKNTSDRYIELLSWLIDFNPRPYKPNMGYDIPQDTPTTTQGPPEEKSVPETILPPIPVVNDHHDHQEEKVTENEIPARIDTPISQRKVEELMVASSERVKHPFGISPKYYKTAIISILAFITLSGSYLIYKYNEQECMYWDGDQYQYTSCEDQKPYGTIVLPLDAYKFDQLKRIKDRKTIRQTDIGKVHYSKTNNEVEFYTIESENPTDTAKRLLPMTDHIYDKYVLGKE